MKTIQQVLFDSSLRHQNLKDAIRLGLFGQSRTEITHNVLEYNIGLEAKISRECNELNNAFMPDKEHFI